MCNLLVNRALLSSRSICRYLFWCKLSYTLISSSMQESSPPSFFPSAISESPEQQALPVTYSQNQSPTSRDKSQNSGIRRKEMTVNLTIGPSKEPVPLMRYAFYNCCRDASIEDTSLELIMKSKSIQSKFSSLIFDICSLLQTSAVPIDKLKMWLSYQSCSKSVECLQVFENDSDALKAGTIPALISSIQCYTSWYNYDLIADIAKKFCNEGGCRLIETYEAELRSYFNTLILQCPPLFPDHEHLTKGLEPFEIKAGWNSSQVILLQDIAIFKSKLCHLCNLDPRFLIIKMVDATNFQMTLAVPKAALEILKEANLPDVDFQKSSTLENSTLITSDSSAQKQLSDNSNQGASACKDETSHNEGNVLFGLKTMGVSGEKLMHPTKKMCALTNTLSTPASTDKDSLQHHQGSSTVTNIAQNVGTETAVSTTPPSKSVSFLWRVLGRARPGCHANIHVVAIQAVPKLSDGDLEVRKGQHLRALYRVAEKVFVETPSLLQGFVPYSSCRLSRKHYGSNSNLIQLSYLRIYPETPDGIDVFPQESILRIVMVAVKDYSPRITHEELRVQTGQVFTALFCDSSWVFAVCGKYGGHGGLLPRHVCALSNESQNIFRHWQASQQGFQSDFIIKHNEPRPIILDQDPVHTPTTLLASSDKRASTKVGKFFTIVQNFVPTTPSNGNFTIRKGLRVKVVEENGQQVRVTTKSGVSFWIPSNHVRPARKSSIGAAGHFLNTLAW